MKESQFLQKQRIAVLEGVGVGDGLVLMTLVNNLKRNGHEVVFFCSGIYPFRQWFNDIEIRPTLKQSELQETLSTFDTVVVDRNIVTDNQFLRHPKVVHLKKRDLDRRLGFVDNLVRISKETFGLSDVIRDINMTPPDNSLVHRKHAKRVLVNPISGHPSKDWPAKKFICLARQLKKKGFEPVFCVSPKQHDDWSALLNNEFPLLLFDTLDKFTAYIYESGFSVSNDSGPGHIASALGVPTLSLFPRKAKSVLWKPAWGVSEAITASIHLPTPYARGFWKQFLTVGKVMKKFNVLQRKTRGI